MWWIARRDKIDMEPSYQRRGRLWSDSDKAYLIDSILNEYDVPKLYMADFTWGDSKLNAKRLPYAIIDGKQRLEAILDFYDGRIVLNEDFVFLEHPQVKLAGLSYRDLKRNYSEIAEAFENYNLMVMSVMAQSETPINELFVRLNRVLHIPQIDAVLARDVCRSAEGRGDRSQCIEWQDGVGEQFLTLG
jgi:hypothetical protein